MNATKQQAEGKTFTASKWMVHTWAIGSMADYMLYMAFALIIPVFNTGFHIKSQVLAIALMLPRVTDALIDPILGHFSDNIKTRWGRRRPFIFAAAILGAMVEFGIWWVSPHWSQTMQLTYITFFSVMLFICYGSFSMTHLSLGYELSDDYSYRTKILAIRNLYFSIGAVGGGYAYWLIQQKWFGDGVHADEINGARWIGSIIAGIILLSGIIPVFTCRERFQNVNRKHVSILKALPETLRVRPFVVILLMRLSQTFGMSFYGLMIFYIGAYSICHGDKVIYSSTISGIGAIAGVIVSLIFVPMASGLTRRMGKRSGLIWSNAMLFTGYIFLPLYFASSTHQNEPSWIINPVTNVFSFLSHGCVNIHWNWLGNLFNGGVDFMQTPGRPFMLLAFTLLMIPANTLMNTFIFSVMPDICDVDELTSGQRREGLFSAVNSFISKMQNSVCSFVGLFFLLPWTGFDETLAHQSQAVLDKMRMVGFGPPIVFGSITLIISFFVPITEAYMKDVRAKLEAKRAATAALPET